MDRIEKIKRHLTTDEDKIVFYKKIYKVLNLGGVFYNADVVLGSSKYLQDIFMCLPKR